jgi:hypothetical protein
MSQPEALKDVRQALLEGINPGDYNAVRPQSLGIFAGLVMRCEY